MYTGTISAPEGFDYFPFEVPDPEEDGQAVAGAPPGSGAVAVPAGAADALELMRGGAVRPFRTLSNGEQTRFQLALLFCGITDSS